MRIVLYRFPETLDSCIIIFVLICCHVVVVSPDVGVVVLQAAPALVMEHEAAGPEALGAGS